MLPKSQRLSRPQDINRVYQRGRFGVSGPFQARELGNNLPDSRAVVVVSKKISKKAVVRNRLRRQTSAQLSSLWPQLTAGLDVVIVVREDFDDMSTAELKKHLSQGLSRAGAIKVE